MSIVNGHPSGVKFKLNKGATRDEQRPCFTYYLPRT